MHPPPLPAADAGRIAKRARLLLRRGLITHRQLAVLDALLWSCRAPGRASCRVSYARLCQLAHVSRETIADAIRRLVAHKLIRVVKHTVLAIWANGGRQRRQAVNEYVLLAPAADCEFGPATVIREQVIKEATPAATLAAREALATVVKAREKLLGPWWSERRHQGLVCRPLGC